MDLALEGKKVVVTGGAKGIGASIVRSFVKEGAVPILLGRNPGEAEESTMGEATSAVHQR